MKQENDKKQRKNIVFLSSSYVNLAKLFALNNTDYDVFLILDRKFPFYSEDEELDNYYLYTFNKNKIFEKNKEKYFDNLGIYIEQFSPDYLICDNFTKLLPKSFIDFLKFRNNNIKILNIHNANLRILDEKNQPKFKGLNADVKQFLETGEIITTIHEIEDEKMDSGKQLSHSYKTDLKELKQKGLIYKKEDILNLRIRNVILSYHLRTKVLNLLKKTLDNLSNK